MGRRDTARRRLAGAGLPSDSLLELSKNGFPPGTTVDELHWYSRRRNNERRQDNLYPESGSLKDVTSEYTRCFRAPPVATHSLGDLTDESHEKRKPLRRFSSQSEDMFNKAANDKWIQRCRRQNLKLEGDMLFHTENADAFIEYVLSQRTDLLRRKTQLKLEGDMDTTTENQEKFIPYENVERPSLMKRSTTLHLEGDHTYVPEYKDLFVEFPRKRPTMTKPSPWLKIESEGKMNSNTETLSQFIGHSNGAKPLPIVRPSNLKCEGDYNLLPEYKENYRGHQDSVRQQPIRQQHCLRVEGDLALLPEYKENYRGHQDTIRQQPIKQQPYLKMEGELRAEPEYKDKFTPFPPVRIRRIRQPDSRPLFEDEPRIPPLVLSLPTEGLNVSADNAGRLSKPPTPPRAVSPAHPSHKTRGNPGKGRESAGKNPRSKNDDRLAGRPPRSTRPEAWSPTKNNPQNKEKPLNNNDDEDFHPRYSIYGTHKYQPMKQPEVMSNSLEGQPEYRKAYLDYLIRERPKKIQDDEKTNKNKSNVDDLPKEPLPENDNKLTKENLAVYQPTTRRGSTTSNHSSPRRRSSSPSYKMHVTNVDEPKKGFGARTTNRSIRQAHGAEPRRGTSPVGYPAQREVKPSNKISTRSNWIKSTAQRGSLLGDEPPFELSNARGREKPPSFVVLDTIGADVQQLRKKWESPWWQNSY